MSCLDKLFICCSVSVSYDSWPSLNFSGIESTCEKLDQSLDEDWKPGGWASLVFLAGTAVLKYVMLPAPVFIGFRLCTFQGLGFQQQDNFTAILVGLLIAAACIVLLCDCKGFAFSFAGRESSTARHLFEVTLCPKKTSNMCVPIHCKP